MLLQEFNPVFKLTVISEGRGGNSKTCLRGKFQEANQLNKNNRIYSKELLERETTKLQGLIDENRLVGELDHPTYDVVKLQNASHRITGLSWEGNDLIGEMELLSTPAGKVAECLLKDGVQLGISSRALGSLSPCDENEGASKVNDDLDMRTYDLVADPSVKGAFPGLTEGVQAERKIKNAYKQVLGEKVFVSMLKESLQSLVEQRSEMEEYNLGKTATAAYDAAKAVGQGTKKVIKRGALPAAIATTIGVGGHHVLKQSRNAPAPAAVTAPAKPATDLEQHQKSMERAAEFRKGAGYRPLTPKQKMEFGLDATRTPAQRAAASFKKTKETNMAGPWEKRKPNTTIKKESVSYVRDLVKGYKDLSESDEFPTQKEVTGSRKGLTKKQIHMVNTLMQKRGKDGKGYAHTLSSAKKHVTDTNEGLGDIVRKVKLGVKKGVRGLKRGVKKARKWADSEGALDMARQLSQQNTETPISGGDVDVLPIVPKPKKENSNVDYRTTGDVRILVSEYLSEKKKLISQSLSEAGDEGFGSGVFDESKKNKPKKNEPKKNEPKKNEPKKNKAEITRGPTARDRRSKVGEPPAKPASRRAQEILANVKRKMAAKKDAKKAEKDAEAQARRSEKARKRGTRAAVLIGAAAHHAIGRASSTIGATSSDSDERKRAAQLK